MYSSNDFTYPSSYPLTSKRLFRFLEKRSRCNLVETIHRGPQFIPSKAKSNSMTIVGLVMNPWSMILDQSVISASSCEYILSLPIEETLKEKTTAIKFVVEAAQRTQVYSPLNLELLGICSKSGYMSED